MSRFWLTYCDPSGRLLGVVILDASSLISARFHAAVEGLGPGVQLFEGHELDDYSAILVPPNAIGRMLSLEEASKIIRRIERRIPKRAAAASVTRRGAMRTKARR